MCRVRKMKKFYSLLYNDRQAVLARRRQQLSEDDYRQKCRLRPAVEGTISQFKRSMFNGKLKVRGLRKSRHRLILKAMGINFKRIAAYVGERLAESLDAAVADTVSSISEGIFTLFSSMLTIFKKKIDFGVYEGAELSLAS